MFDRFLPKVFRREADKEEGSLPERFEDFFTAPFSRLPFAFGSSVAVDMRETEDEVLVSAELPGVDPKEVELSVENDRLVIRGEKRHEKKEEKKGYLRMERSYGSFHRIVPLPSGVLAEKAKADFDKGVLTVHLPKDEAAKPKRIAVTG